MTAAQHAAETRLKAERRKSAAARGDRDTQTKELAAARDKMAEAKRNEEAAKAALATARHEIAEVKTGLASVQQERALGELERSSVTHQYVERVSQQRNIALQEVGALAQELESLQVALASPQRDRRSAGHAAGMPSMVAPHYPPHPQRHHPPAFSPVWSPVAAVAYSRPPPSTGCAAPSFPTAASKCSLSGRYAQHGGRPPVPPASALAQQYVDRDPPVLDAVPPSPRLAASAVARPTWG